MKTIRLGALLLVAALSCSKSPTAPVADFNIGVADYAFTPESLNVQVGKVIQWTNSGPSNHAVASDSGSWTTLALAAPGGGGPYGGGSGPTSAQLVIHTGGGIRTTARSIRP